MHVHVSASDILNRIHEIIKEPLRISTQHIATIFNINSYDV